MTQIKRKLNLLSFKVSKLKLKSKLLLKGFQQFYQIINMNLKLNEENYEDFDIEKGASKISVCNKSLLFEKMLQAGSVVECAIPFFIVNSDLIPFRNNWSLSVLKMTPLSFTNLFVRISSSILLIVYCIYRYYLNNRVDETSETKMKIKKAFDFMIKYLFCDTTEFGVIV